MNQKLTEKLQIRLSPELLKRLEEAVRSWSSPAVQLSASDVVRAVLDQHLPPAQRVEPKS